MERNPDTKVSVRARTPIDTAKLLGFSNEEARLMEIRVVLRQKIREAMKKQNLTHEQLAQLAGTSRARITRLTNDGKEPVTIDFLIKLLGALGYETSIKLSKSKKKSA